jgi:membrane associated rhomboid family serine protease
MSNKDDKNDQDDPKIARFPQKGERPRPSERHEPPPVANDYRSPNGKGEPIFNIPPMVKWLCFSLIVINAGFMFVDDNTKGQIFMLLGFISARYSGIIPFDWPAVAAPVAHLFLHGGWLHVAVNVGMLMAFGSALERAIGAKRLFILYILSGFGGALTHWAFEPQSIYPLIGASGAISGLFGGVLMVMQRQGMMGDPTRYGRLLLFIGIWVGITIFFGFAGMPGAEGNIAWTAHVGGFVIGMLLFNALVREPVQFR